MIDLLIPSRCRADRLLETLNSAKTTADNLDNVHAIIYLDGYDDSDYTKTFGVFNKTTIIRGHNDVLSKLWNVCFDAGKGKIVMHCADDIIFESKGWDTIVENHFKDNKISLLYGMDGHQDKNCPTHSFTLRKAAEIIGYYLPPYFTADWNDVWLGEVYKKLDRIKYDPSIMTRHLHVNVDKKYDDAIYQLAQQRRAAANLMFEKKKHEIDEWVEKLKEIM